MRAKLSVGAILIGLVLTCTLTGCGLPAGAARVEVNPDIADFKVKTVAILPLEGKPVTKEVEEFWGWSRHNFPNSGEMISDVLATELVGVRGFHYIERAQVRKVLEEQGFSLSELVSKKTPSDIGRLLGADAVVLGTVSMMEFRETVLGVRAVTLSFSVRMVHTETGDVLWSANVGREEDGTKAVLDILREECRRIVEQVRAKLPSKPTQ